MKPKWLYRLESKDPNNGLWYNNNAKFVWGIGQIKGCKTKYLPMDYDERYHKDGKIWHSSCSNREDLSHWYSLDDAKELIANGFVFTRYLATEYVEYELETTFVKETSLKREELNIEDIMRLIDYKFSELELVFLLSIDRIQSAINAFDNTLGKEEESFVDNNTQEIYQQINAVMRENWKLKNLLNSKKTELLEKQKR